MINISNYIANENLKIIVKIKSKKTEIIGYNPIKKAVLVNIAALPKDNKANVEIIKYFSKILKKKVRIKSGLSSKEKLLQIE